MTELLKQLNKILRETEWTDETTELLSELQRLIDKYED